MEKPWMPVVAGILDIVSGSLGLCMGLFMIFAKYFYSTVPRIPGWGMYPLIPEAFFPGMGIALILIGVLAIIGGVYALKIKNWGMALAGSICACLSGRFLGILALIFTVLAKKEFK